MARKTKIVTIADEGRDKGKTFLITEKSAMDAERWATRALFAIMQAGIDIPPEVLKLGVGAVAALGFRALLTMAYHDAEPLLAEMLSCIAVVPNPKTPAVVRPVDDDDIEEVGTLFRLRSEVIELHTGFSVAAFLSKLGTAADNQTPA